MTAQASGERVTDDQGLAIAARKTSCTCVRCIARCKKNPGWMTPQEAALAIDAGYADHLMLDWLALTLAAALLVMNTHLESIAASLAILAGK